MIAATHTLLHFAVEVVEVLYAARTVGRRGELAVVAKYAVESLQGQVIVENGIQHAHRLHVVIEPQPYGLLKKFVEYRFACVPERRMTYVVPDGYSLNEVGIESQRAAHRTGYARNELDVQGAASYVVVAVE